MRGPLRVGVVGMGGRGRYLARAFREDPRTDLVAVCDVSDESTRAARSMLADTVSYYTDQNEMCAREGLKIGVVASWDPAHTQNTITFLEHNIHVYLEKPMAQTIDDCDHILRAWEKSKSTLMIGLELRYCTLCQEIR